MNRPRVQLQPGESSGVEHPKVSTLRSIANRWIKITRRCWLDKRPYDEAVYQARGQNAAQTGEMMPP